MPTYEYRCEQGHTFEVFQRISEPPVEKCVQCGARAERLLSAGAGLLFKGSGFYTTDYRSETYKKAAESEKGSAQPAKPGDGSGAKPADASKGGSTSSSSSSGSE